MSYHREKMVVPPAEKILATGLPPPVYFPQVTNWNKYSLKVPNDGMGNKKYWKISFVVITFLDDKLFHPSTVLGQVTPVLTRTPLKIE